MKQIGAPALTSSGRILSAQVQNCGRTARIVGETVEYWHPRISNPLAFKPLRLEARVGIEPTNEAFAEPCLTTWLPRLSVADQLNQRIPTLQVEYRITWL